MISGYSPSAGFVTFVQATVFKMDVVYLQTVIPCARIDDRESQLEFAAARDALIDIDVTELSSCRIP